MMKQYFSFVFFGFAFLLLHSQQVTIQWKEAEIRDFGIQKLKLPAFQNDGFSFDQNNIFINTKQKVGEKDLIITDLVWQDVPDSQLYDLNKDALADYDIAGISYKDTRDGKFAFSTVALFKNDKGQAKRLVSYKIAEGKTLSLPKNMGKIGTTTNPLATGTFYKIKIDKSGIFKITSQFLQSNGISPSSINPKNFRIYGNGGVLLPEFNLDTRYDALQENAIQVVGEDDGVWNDADYALFYAQGPDGYNLYDSSNGLGYKRTETRMDRSNHVKNIYEDYSYYFINFDKGPGKRVQNVDEALPPNLVSRYDDYQFINNDKKNLIKVGRIWVEESGFTSPKTVTFNTKSPIQPGDVVKYRTQVIGYNTSGNSISVNVNNQNTSSQNSSVFPFTQLRFQGNVSNLSGNSININLTPNTSANPNGLFYFDYAEVQYKENLAFNGTQMNFRDFSFESGTSQNYGFTVSNAGNLEQIWDVSDITNANKRVNKSSGTFFNFGYVADNLYFNNEFVAFRADAAYTPSFVGKIETQNLHGLQNVDYLIITKPEMLAQAQRLANYHQTKNNYNVKIVDTDKIYNEFGSGSRDITAIRDFVTFINTSAGNLKYVLIIGDATYDPKNRISNNNNIVTSYLSEESSNLISSFITDDYYVMTSPQMNPYIPGNLPDLPIGRIPAATVAEAAAMVDKTLAYYNSLPGQSNPFGIWRMKGDFVVDDDKDGGTPFHNLQNAALVQIFEGATDKPEYNIRKLYLDSFQQVSTSGGHRYPQVNQAISNDFGNSLYFFYFGHGGPNGWAQERVLTADEVQNFNNFSPAYTRFPIVSTITCEFMLWDDPDIFSVGEQVMKHKSGGAVTMLSSSRAIDVSYGINFTQPMNQELFRLYSDDFETLGNAFLLAKTTVGPNSNHLKVNFMGDPAMKMNRPKRLLAFDNIQTPIPGLMRALDFVKITGHVKNANGTINTTFNGKVVINIYDKRQNKSTLNNDGVLTPVLNYTEEGSAIVKASGNVINGVFTVEFYVPNDINYTVGTGRILGYADNKVYDVFNNMPYQIGDINPNGINDNQPPKVKLYMNNTNFANGGITNQNPMLLACITDDTGINSTGAGIGHDITVYLDGKIINTVVLNDYFSPGDGNGCLNPTLADYQKGNVTYPFRNLTPGEHTLTFKVWDINNNSTTSTLTFIVKDETNQQLEVNRLLNWPNPFTDKTYIQFEHNCDDILDVNVQIYTITGKLVKTISQTVIAEPFLQGFRTPRQAIEWDGTDDYGATVGKGTYIFKIFARSKNQEKCKGGATAVEKMVLLK